MSIARWIMGANREVEKLDEEAFSAEIKKNYRWNFTFNLLDGATFWFGSSFMATATIAPIFVRNVVSDYTDNETIIKLSLGILAMIVMSGWSLPQLLVANLTERFGRMKPIVINLGFFLERLPLWFLVIAALIAKRAPLLALVLGLLSLAWHIVGAGVIAPAWQTLLARLFPVERRGRFMGLTMFVGAGTGLLGAEISARVLANVPYPNNFAILFAVAAGFITISWLFLAAAREPIPIPTQPKQDNRRFWQGVKTIFKHDHNYRRYLLARALAGFGGMGYGFVAVAAIDIWSVSEQTAGYYTMAVLGGQTIGNLIFGWLADRRGHKLPLEIGFLSSALAFAAVWLADGPVWFFVSFMLLGFTNASFIVSGIMVVMEFCAPERVPTYAGLTNTVVGVFSMVSPLLGAWLAKSNYGLLFAFSALFNVLGMFALRFWVKEPRWAEKAVFPQETVE